LPSGPYYYKVAAVNDLGEGNQSVGFGLGVILPPASVLTLQAANTAVALTWLPPAGYPNLTYAVYRATAPGVAVTPANRIASGLTHPTYIDTGLTNDTTYYYVVTGISGYGEGGPSNEVSGTPFTTPDMPAAVTVAAAGNGEVRVDWVPGSDNGTTRTHFTVTVPGCATCVSPGASPDASSAIVEDVPTGTWTATVQANAVDGNSADGTALDSLIATAPIGATVHTVRFVSQPLGDDAAGPAPAVPGADPTSGNDCTVAPGAAANSVLETKPCATIGRALGLAQPGDEVVVASGTYTEGADDPAASGPTAAATVGAGLWLTQPRELVAQPDTGPVVIDATGHDHGFGVRLGNAGNTVSGTVVTISGFTVRNAGSDGILVADSSHVAVADDVIENSPVGLRLTGVNHATVTRNTLQHNKTGLVLSDADGPVWANTLTGNSVSDNTSGGGILLSAHGSWLTGDAAGIFTNTIKGNSVLRDGAGGAGAGIKLDVAEPGGQIYDNTITGNVVRSTQQAGIVLDAHSVFDYLDDNVITANTISGTGAYRPGGARASTGMALHGTAAAPIGGTVVRANTISAVHVGVFANEAGVSPSPFGFTNVAVHVQRVPAARFVYAVRGHNRHLLTTSGGRAVADRGGSLASAPAVSARPHWTANGYDGSLSAVYAARMTDGSLQYRSDSTPWRAVALPPKVRMAGAPAILGAIWDPAGRSELTLAFTDTGGHVWLRDLILAPDLTVVGTNLPWTSLGTAGGGLAGSPALVVLDSNGFFEPTIFAAGRNGVVYQHDSNTTHPWTRTRFHAAAVAGGLTPDWTTAELVLVTRGAHGNVSTVRNVEGTWAAVHREAIPSTGQPGIALATNGTSLAYVARSGRLSARIGGSTLGFSVRPSMGTGVTALN
jgi:parallel beta-helix repeat protein